MRNSRVKESGGLSREQMVELQKLLSAYETRGGTAAARESSLSSCRQSTIDREECPLDPNGPRGRSRSLLARRSSTTMTWLRRRSCRCSAPSSPPISARCSNTSSSIAGATAWSAPYARCSLAAPGRAQAPEARITQGRLHGRKAGGKPTDASLNFSPRPAVPWPPLYEKQVIHRGCARAHRTAHRSRGGIRIRLVQRGPDCRGRDRGSRGRRRPLRRRGPREAWGARWRPRSRSPCR